MRVLAVIFLSFFVGSAFADIPAGNGKTQTITNDNRVVYSQPDNKLYSVQKQRVCTENNGKQQCYERAVATLIPK